MSDEQLDPEERRLADLFRQVEAPASMRRWDRAAAAGVGGGAGGAAWWARPFLALFTAGGERRLRPLAAALVLPLLVLVVGGGMQLRAHFAGSGSGDGATPPARYSAAMAFDSARGQVVLFGGRTADAQVLGDTWTWDGGSWTQQHPRQSPAPRSDAHMAFDAAHGLMVLYGGTGGFTQYAPMSSQPASNLSEETWTWDGSNWHQVITGHRPNGQVVGMAYDEKRSQLLLVDHSFGIATATMGGGGGMVLHGGPAAAGASAPKPLPTPAPSRSVSTTVTVTATAVGSAAVPLQAQPAPVQVVPLNPPTQYTPPAQQTWTWTGSDWKLVATDTSANWRTGASGPPAWDDAAKRVVMLTLETGRLTCAVTGQSGVIQAVPAPGVVNGSTTNGAAGGSAGWSGYSPLVGKPTANAPATPKPAATGAAPSIAATGPVPVRPPCTDNATQHGAGSPTSSLHCTGCPVAHQWSWDGSAWREMKLGNEPSFLGQQLAADAATGQLIAVDSSRTWTWLDSKWSSHLNPAGLRMRNAFSLAADTAHHVVVLFGGRPFGDRTVTAAADTWTWNGSTWTHVAGTVPPPAVTSYASSGPPTMLPGGNRPGIACSPRISVTDAGGGAVAITLSLPPNTAQCVGGLVATLTLRDPSGANLDVLGNGIPVTAMPSTLRWTNWCGTRAGSVEVRAGNSTIGQSIDIFPTCGNRSKPSQLSIVSTGHPGVTVP